MMNEQINRSRLADGEVIPFLRGAAASLGRLGVDAETRAECLQLIVDELADTPVNGETIAEIACSVSTSTEEELRARLRAWADARPGESA